MHDTLLDEIFLEGISIFTYIGIHPWESSKKQLLYLDLKMFIHPNLYVSQQELEPFGIDYCKVYQSILAYADVHKSLLLEHFGHHLCLYLFERWAACQKIFVQIKKPSALPQINATGVALWRSKLCAPPTYFLDTK